MRVLPKLVAASGIALVAAAAPSRIASAQTPPLGAPAQPAPATKNPALPPNATPAPSSPLAPAPVPPPKVEVDDPLLAPVPPPAKVLTSWQEALNFINQRTVNVLVAQQEIKKAEGLYREALAAALPTITGTGKITHDFTPHNSLAGTGLNETPPATSWLASLTVTQPILAPQAWYALKTNKLEVKAAQESTEDIKRTTLITVANAIVAVVTAERTADLNRVGLRSTLELLDLTVRKQKLGSGTMLDVTRAQQNVATARQTLVTGDESLKEAREALGLALGFADSYGVATNISLNDIATTVNHICTPAAPDQRTDVLVAKTNLEVAERGVTNVKLAYAPTASVSSTVLAESPSISGQPIYGDWSIQGLLTLPIWDGGLRYGQMKVAEADREEARYKVDAAVRQSTIDSVQSNRSVKVAEDTRQISQQARDLAVEIERLTKIAYEAGTDTSFDLVNANTAARQAELNLAVAEFEVVKAKIASLLANANCNY